MVLFLKPAGLCEKLHAQRGVRFVNPPCNFEVPRRLIKPNQASFDMIKMADLGEFN